MDEVDRRTGREREREREYSSTNLPGFDSEVKTRRKCALGSRASMRSAEQRRREQSWWIMTPDQG
jgi:hypothetical protein